MSLAGLKRNVSLKALNTLGIPASTEYCVACTNIDEIHGALAFAKQKKLPLMVLGEGSNTIFSADYSGLVLLNRLRGIECLNDTKDWVEVRVAAGENWHEFVDFAIRQGWFGLENLALIPGLVGASPIQNIGAYGVEVKDFIKTVDYLDIETSQLKTLTKQQCLFSYRNSIFKQELADRGVITAVTFRLPKTANCKLDYPALAEKVEKDNDPRIVFDAVCEIRAAKLPNPKEIPNAGSFFKNPIISARHYQTLVKENPDIIAFESVDGFKVAAAWLIEHLGWKRKELGGVKVHAQHALVVVNPQHQNGARILALAKAIQLDVKAKFLIDLEIEPRLY